MSPLSSIDEVADRLWAKYHEEPWYAGLGRGIRDGVPTLFLFVRKGKKAPDISSECGGIPLLVQKMGKIAT